jgi:septum site-determining protein MinC
MSAARKALEFKGRMLSVTRVRVADPDLSAIETQLRDFARSMPQAVQGMPVVIEGEALDGFDAIVGTLRAVGMQPIGVADGPLAAVARRLGLAVLQSDAGNRPVKSAAAEAPSPAAGASASAGRKAARVVTEPVRSGQQIYAEGSDLIVTNTVSAGAEVIADGCVHVYAALRGRAVAGGRGDTTARIFCRKFEAELVAIAGVYAVAEQMEGALKGKPVQAFLKDGKLRIERLDW